MLRFADDIVLYSETKFVYKYEWDKIMKYN